MAPAPIPPLRRWFAVCGDRWRRAAAGPDAPGRRSTSRRVAQSERTVDSLATEIGLSLANASQHLQALRQAALVDSRKDGLFAYYRLAGPEVFELASEYVAGHIPVAISVPVNDLEQRLQQLTKGKEYVAYCRGPYCVYADRAVELLRANGRRARRLLDGFPEWRGAGLPVASGVQPGVLK